MITRVVQRKQPRRLAMLAVLSSAVAAIGLFAVTALATVTDAPTSAGCNVQVANKNGTELCTTVAGAKVRYIGDSNQTFGASGTGTFNPFVRLQASPTERGYNTNGTLEFDTKGGTWTHAIKVSEIPVRTEDGCVNCWELFVDINDGNSNKPVSLNDMEIWFTQSATLTGYGTSGFASGATREYDFAGNILINDVNQGSGRGDLRYMVPRTGITIPADCQYGNPNCTTYFVLYSRWGAAPAGFPSDGGFEEWKVKVYPTPPDISVAKTPDGATISAGDNAVFTIVVTNNGPIAAENVTLTDTLPAGFAWTLGGPDAGDCSIASGTLSCNFGTIPFPGSQTVTLTAPTDSADCGTINNTATVAASNEDAAQLGNNSDSGSITVNCPDVSVTKTPDGEAGAPGTIAPGANAVFTITFTNNGPGVASGVTLSDSLPATNLDWSISSQGLNPGYSGGSACSLSAGDVLSCSLTTLAAGASYRVVVSSATDADNCGTIPNTVTVSATGDIDPTNDSDTGSISVLCGAIEITKTAKHKDDSGGTSANLDATFTITGPSPSTVTRTVATGADGVGCVDGLAFGSYEVEETTVPTGYAAPAKTTVTVDNAASCSDATFGGEAVGVENTPLTDVTWSVDSLVSGATQTIVTCYDSAGEIIDGYPITITADDDGGDGTATLEDLFPTAPGTVTVSCDFEIDP